jgi:hypothetical protein
MSNLIATLRTWLTKARVVLVALPTILAVATGLAVYIGTEVVPDLPDPWGIRAAAIVAAVLTFLRVAGEFVARLTTVLPAQRGVLNPEGTRVETHTVIEADYAPTEGSYLRPGSTGAVHTYTEGG